VIILNIETTKESVINAINRRLEYENKSIINVSFTRFTTMKKHSDTQTKTILFTVFDELDSGSWIKDFYEIVIFKCKLGSFVTFEQISKQFDHTENDTFHSAFSVKFDIDFINIPKFISTIKKVLLS